MRDAARRGGGQGDARRSSELRADFNILVVEGEIATCDMVRLELLYSARNADEFGDLAEELDALPHCPIGEAEWRRASWVYAELAADGGAHPRSVKHPDLLIAAVAESAGIPVLHYDQDYDRIAATTGQPQRWLAPRGTLR